MTKPLTFALALVLAVGTAVACGDDEEGGGGKGGSSGSSGSDGKGGSSGKGGTSGQGGSSGSSGSSATGGTGGKGGSAGKGGTAGEGGMPNGGQGGEAPGGAGGEGGDAPTCEVLANTAPVVGEVQRTGSVPAPQGGTITDGRYHMLPWDVYPPATASSSMRSLTLYVTGNRFEVVGTSANGPQRLSLIGATNGTELTLTNSGDCPGGDPNPSVNGYTATPVSIALIRTDSRSRVETFVKACNDLEVLGSLVPETQQTGTMPTPAGGTIEQGTYVLTSFGVYSPGTATPSNMRTTTIRIEANTIEIIGNEITGSILSRSASYSTAGSNITLTPTCPVSGMADMTAYTATQGAGATFRIIRAGQNRVETFTKQ